MMRSWRGAGVVPVVADIDRSLLEVMRYLFRSMQASSSHSSFRLVKIWVAIALSASMGGCVTTGAGSKALAGPGDGVVVEGASDIR
jgi:hypothetical protein